MTDLPETVGTLGAGNMAEAILRGLLRAGLAPERILAADPDPNRRKLAEKELGIRVTDRNREVVEKSQVVLLAVKPAHVEAALEGLPSNTDPLWVSIVAGCRIATLRAHLGPQARIVRVMPNTPALIGAGISALARGDGVSPHDLGLAEKVLEAVGQTVRVPESWLDAVTGLSGSGPAYVFSFIEALGEAGVREGCSPEIARKLAIETVLGAARLVAESGEHPAILRERVTSPAGTTAAGLAALAQGGFRAAVLSAVRAATARSRELGGK